MSRLATLAVVCSVVLLGGSAIAAAAVYGPSRPTRAEFVNSAEGICAKSNAKINKLNKKKKYVKGAQAFGGRVRALAKLSRPADDQAVLGRWLKSLRTDASLYRRFAKALSGGDIAKAKKVAKAASRQVPKTNRIVRGFGFKNCLIQT